MADSSTDSTNSPGAPRTVQGYRFAGVTGRSAQRFYQLLCRFGLDELLDASREAAREHIETGTPQGLTGSLDDASGEDGNDEDAPTGPGAELALSIDLGAIIYECAYEGAIGDLAEIVIDEAPGGKEPIDAPAEVLGEAVRDFGQGSFALIGGVLSFAMN